MQNLFSSPSTNPKMVERVRGLGWGGGLPVAIWAGLMVCRAASASASAGLAASSFVSATSLSAYERERQRKDERWEYALKSAMSRHLVSFIIIR
jgi:hypothetical protein